MEADYIMLEQFNHGWSNQQINDFERCGRLVFL